MVTVSPKSMVSTGLRVRKEVTDVHGLRCWQECVLRCGRGRCGCGEQACGCDRERYLTETVICHEHEDAPREGPGSRQNQRR